jgi:hypothetical protein
VFEPPYCDINKDGFGYTYRQRLETVFEDECKGKTGCFFPLNKTFIPSNCT